MNQTKATIDHDVIRRWAEKRGAHPARVKRTARSRGDVGMIAIDFPGYSGKGTLEEIEWDEFFEKFDDSGLALVYRDKLADGRPSNFNKLVGRETVDVRERSGRKTAPSRRSARRAAPRVNRAATRKTRRARPSRKGSGTSRARTQGSR